MNMQNVGRYATHANIDLGPLCSDSGWALDTIIAWLMTEGRQIADPTRFADELCRRLTDAGAPLWRVRFSFQTIHPQVAACAFTWVRGRDSTEFCLLHGDETGSHFGNWVISRRHDKDSLPRHYLKQLDSELYRLVAKGGIDYVVVPLVFSTGEVNTFIAATASPGGFSEADITKFETLTAFLSPVLEVIATRRVARTLLDTYVGRRTGSKILDGMIKRGDGDVIEAALCFSDLRDFTLLTETLAASALLSMLNAYFEFVAAAVNRHGGEVLRFIGDAMLIVFPSDQEGGTGSACKAALGAAIDSFDNLAAVNRQREQAGEPLIRFGIGLHVGKVIYGTVGAPDRLEFTVMGPAVNRAARLESLTKEVGAPLLLSAEFVGCIDHPVRSLGCYEMRGVAEAREVFTLADYESTQRLSET